jgi:hypothetical protein
MTFLESAIFALQSNGNQPMSARDIWKYLSTNNLVTSKGKTPWASINTLVGYYTKDCKFQDKTKNPIFNQVSSAPAKFTLIDFQNVDKEVDSSLKSDKVLLYQVTSKELDWKKLSLFNNNDSIEYELSECEDFTYIMEDKAHATVKIGRSIEPEKRFSQLKTANPSITLLHVFPSSQFSESELHSKFEDFRKDLEWFFKTKGLEKFLSNEIEKRKSIIDSFKKKNELNELENKMINIL